MGLRLESETLPDFLRGVFQALHPADGQAPPSDVEVQLHWRAVKSLDQHALAMSGSGRKGPTDDVTLDIWQDSRGILLDDDASYELWQPRPRPSHTPS